MTGEPETSKGRATRARIVDAAAELIRHSGVAAGSLGAVEKAAGVGRSQLYHYFSDREDLLHAVVTRNGHGLADRATTALGRRRGAAALNEWFDAAIAANVAGGGVGGCPLGSLAGQLAETGETTRELLVEMFAQWEEPVLRTLTEMQVGGELRPEIDVRRLADQIMAAMQGGLLMAQVRRDPAQLAAALDGARQLIAAGAVSG